MADSKRKQIVDAAIAAIAGVIGVTTVTEDVETWEASNTDDMSLVYVDSEIDDEEELCFPHVTSPDRQATMTLAVEGAVQEYYGADTETSIDELSAGIKAALLDDSALAALIVDIRLKSQQQVWDVQDTYGMCSQQWELTYIYNHNSP